MPIPVGSPTIDLRRVPNRDTSDRSVDRWNQAWRASPQYAQVLRQVGVDPSRRFQLSDRQREQAKLLLRAQGINIPGGMELDPSGNLNQNNTLARNAAIAAAIAGTAIGGYYALPALLGGGGAGAAGAGAGTAAGGAGAAGGAAAGGGLLASSSLPAAVTMGAIPSTGLAAGGNALAALAGLGGAAGAAGAGGAGAGGALGFLRNNWRDLAGLAGAGLGATSQAQAENRGAQFAGQLDLERLLIDRDRDYLDRQLLREQEGRAGTQDAWRKLLASQHTLSPGAQPHVSPYAVAPRQASDVERQGAEALAGTSLGRLTGGNPIAPVTERPLSVDPSLLRAGGLEQTTGWLAPVLDAANLYGRWRNPGGPVPTSRTPTRVEYYGG